MHQVTIITDQITTITNQIAIKCQGVMHNDLTILTVSIIQISTVILLAGFHKKEKCKRIHIMHI